MHLFARVTGIGSPAASGNAAIRVYPVDDASIAAYRAKVGPTVKVTDQTDLQIEGISELQFWGTGKTFTVGSVIWGECNVVREEAMQSYDPADPLHKAMVPRVQLDDKGVEVLDKDGNPIICRRLTIAWKAGSKSVRALPADEAVAEVTELPITLAA